MMGSWPGIFLDEPLLFVSSRRVELFIVIIWFPTKLFFGVFVFDTTRYKRVFVFIGGLRFWGSSFS